MARCIVLVDLLGPLERMIITRRATITSLWLHAQVHWKTAKTTCSAGLQSVASFLAPSILSLLNGPSGDGRLTFATCLTEFKRIYACQFKFESNAGDAP